MCQGDCGIPQAGGKAPAEDMPRKPLDTFSNQTLPRRVAANAATLAPTAVWGLGQRPNNGSRDLSLVGFGAKPRCLVLGMQNPEGVSLLEAFCHTNELEDLGSWIIWLIKRRLWIGFFADTSTHLLLLSACAVRLVAIMKK